MSQIFISYSRKDLTIAEKIINALTKDDLEPWIDWKNIPKGETFDKEIYHGIEESEIFLFLASPDSSQSEWCNKEITHAVKNGKRILPIVIRDTDPKIIHPEISKRNWIFCRDRRDDFNKAIEETRDTIHTDYKWLKYHTELQVKALKWELYKDISRLLRGKGLREAEEQLARAGNLKDPPPTDLHRNYVLASQRSEVRQRRQITSSLGFGLVILAALALFAWNQRDNALNSEATAIAEANAKATALVNEENARSTAQAEKERAEEQAGIALARQLAAQSELTVGNAVQIGLSNLLAIESFKHSPTLEGDVALRKAVALLPDQIKEFDVEPKYPGLERDISALAISPDDQWLAVGSLGNIVEVYDTSQWERILRIVAFKDTITSATVRAMTFSPDSSKLFFVTDSGYLEAYDVMSGVEVFKCQQDEQLLSTAVTPDGRKILSGGEKTITVWDAQTGVRLLTKTTEGAIMTLSSDGSLVASGENSGVLTVWRVESGETILQKTLVTSQGPTDLRAISSITISPDSTLVAAGIGSKSKIFMEPRRTIGGEIRVLEIKTGKEVVLDKHSDEVKNLLFSTDGKRLISAGYDGFIQVWNTRTWQTELEIPTGDAIESMQALEDERWLLGSGKVLARVWDTRSGKEISRIIPENLADLAVTTVIQQKEYLVFGDNNGRVSVWKVVGDEITKKGFNGSISWVSTSPNGKLIAAGDWSGMVRVWDAASGSDLCKWSEEGRVAYVAFSPNGNYLAVGRLNGKMSLVSLLEDCFVEQLPQLRTIGEISFSPDGNYLAFSEGIPPRDGWFIYQRGPIAGGESVVVIWDMRTDKELRRLVHDDWVNSIDFSRNSQRLVSASDDKTVRIWEIRTGKELYRIEHSERVNLARFSPDGKKVAFAGSCFARGFGGGTCNPSTLKVWDFESAKLAWEVQLNAAWVPSLAFSPDGRLLFSVNNYTTTGCEKNLAACINLVQVWDASTGNELTRMDHGFDVIIAFGVSSDGKWLASGGADGAVRIWDPLTGKEAHRLLYKEPWAVAFSPDAQWVAVGGHDDSAVFARSFPLSQSKLMEMACSRLNRNLTPEEWKQYIGDEAYRATCQNIKSFENQ